MAVEFPRSAVPPLPKTLARLRYYLFDRDVGIPTAKPAGGTIEAGDPDVLTWSFHSTVPPGGVDFRRADGFLVAMAPGDTAQPWIDGTVFRLSIQATKFVMPGWADGAPRSYAVAAYRNTWQGEQATGWLQPPEWKGAS